MSSLQKIIITIDGWSSCGKSTLAKQLAKELGYIYIDSGAMYRAITLYFLRNHINWTDNKKAEAALKDINLEFIYNNITGKSDIYLNDENAEALIRDMLVSENVSNVSTIKEVREFAVARGVTDIAIVKKTVEEVMNNLAMRDYIDSNREVSPLRKADDAIVLDNSKLTMEEQLKMALKWVKENIV